jgi:hypothetical protein
LRQWVSQGGTLILVKRAASWATQKPASLLSVQRKKFKPRRKTGAKPAADKPPDSAAEPTRSPPTVARRLSASQGLSASTG